MDVKLIFRKKKKTAKKNAKKNAKKKKKKKKTKKKNGLLSPLRTYLHNKSIKDPETAEKMFIITLLNQWGRSHGDMTYSLCGKIPLQQIQ